MSDKENSSRSQLQTSSKMHPTLLLCYFAAVVSFCSTSSTAADDELSALLSIKSALIDPLGAFRYWDPSSAAITSALPAHCSWTGIHCNSQGYVDGLDLSRMNLSGQISNKIWQLPHLTRLNLCCNSFTTIPPTSISSFPELIVLDFSDNSFSGEFPDGLGSFLNLKVLNASGNNFSGRLPEDITNLTSLEILDLRGSLFGGSIPSSYKSLKRLKFLGLSGNNLTGEIPPELGELSSLETLIIGYNSFHGRIPPELGNVSSLQYLDLAVGNLSGSIPPELGKLKLLNTVYLYNNNLDGEIPKELSNLSSLVLLDFSDNGLSGSIPRELAGLKKLQLFNLMCNGLTGPVPTAIGWLPKLEVLELWNNSLTGPLPPELGRHSGLQWLDVSSNSLSGNIPSGICDAGNITKLILFNNAFSGLIPSGLATCISLIRVRLQSNRLNGTVPSGLGRLPRLQRLELAGNDLAGEIPSDIAASTSLAFIDLSGNRLQLSLPSSILSIPTLQTFLASNNELTGEIPDQLQDCPVLASLDLSNNHLSGGIPASLASCDKLVNLNLRNNTLAGEIPKAIAMMPTLAILDLSRNQLTGAIPQNFGSSPALETLNLSYNYLSGEVPMNGILRTVNPEYLAGNAGLCGGILPPCFPSSGWSPITKAKGAHFRHIVAGWMMAISIVFAAAVALFVASRLYRRWYLTGWPCNERFGNERGAWPWRLIAFQRLSFSSSDILTCINDSYIIGMGATGIVYKAEMQRPRITVAVKKLWREAGGSDAAEIWSSGKGNAGEVGLLGRLRHRNIVRLLGCLQNDVDTMILYEYMPNGSLFDALHGPHSGQLLPDWVSRYTVAVGVAQGLAYLHHDCNPPVIHRDVKSNNILLDANLEARIADFGLARMLMKTNETVSEVAGSYGYIAPEYGYTLKVDQKSDIYSFGVVMMELITGKRPIEPEEFGDSKDIVGWVKEKLQNNRVAEVLDPSIGAQCKHVQEEMLMVMRIAVLCTVKLPKDRPWMRDVLMMLGEAKPRRKSSGSTASTGGRKEKPVFSTSPDSEYL